MLPDRSETGEFILRVIFSFREIIAVLILGVQALVLIVYTMEDFGVPRWAAIAGLASFPVVCYLVVECSTNGTGTMTSLALSSVQEGEQESRERIGSRSPIAPSAEIPRVIEERRQPTSRLLG